MTSKTHVDLFGNAMSRFEYYPVLTPDEAGLNEIKSLNQQLVAHGVKPSQLVKLSHISLDGVICPEDDDEVTANITSFLSLQKPLLISFTEMGYYPGRGGITLKLGVANAETVLEFNRNFMAAIGGKVTKLDLHLTLARYVNPEIFDRLKQPDIIVPKTCHFGSVAIYKKEYKAKGSYEVIGSVDFGVA